MSRGKTKCWDSSPTRRWLDQSVASLCVRGGGMRACCVDVRGWAQQSIGTVGIADATVAGALEVSNGRAMLVGASTVTARDHTAEIALNRGGR